MGDPQLRWFRTWTDIVDDAKLLLLAPSDRWYYVALLALKRSGMLDEGDEIAVSDRKVAIRLRLTDLERDELRRRLVEARLIDEHWQPSGWDKRQFESDVSTDRVRKFRRSKKRFGNVSATPEQRFGNAPESEQSQSQSQSRSGAYKTPLPPEGLDLEAWAVWQGYRKLKPKSIPLAWKKLASFGADQMAVVEQSVANGYQGLFPLKRSPQSKSESRLTANLAAAEEFMRRTEEAA